MDIYRYKDFRRYLKDFYADKKAKNPRYSYALFSQKAGLKSPNTLKRVIDGTRSITHKNLRGFIVGLGLKTKEARYFENLVMFNQSANQEMKDYYFEELKQSCRKNNSVFMMDVDYYDYFSHWYAVAIREMVNLRDFQEDLEWICKRLKHKIKKQQAKRALDLLLKLGLLKRDETGRLRQAHLNVKYLKEIRSLAMQKFHHQMIDLAKEAILRESHDQREPSSLTVCVKEKDFHDIKKRIEAFRQELNTQYSCQPSEGKDVLQINFQLFSLIKPPEEGRI